MIKTCKTCGAPFSRRDLNWTSGGVIEQKTPPYQRQVLCECDFIDPLFEGISSLLGLPIDHIVIESRRREVRKYVEARYPAALRKGLRSLADAASGDGWWKRRVRHLLGRNFRRVFRGVSEIGKACGYGDILPDPQWDLDNRYAHRVHTVRNPYSLLLYMGETLGSAEAWDLEDLRIEAEEVGDATFRITLRPGEHPLALAERLQLREWEYVWQPGDIAYEHCPGCGLPREVSALRWDLERGLITDPSTGRRMAFFSSGALEAVLDDLEAELGESIPDAVAASQRDFVKKHWGPAGWRVSGAAELKRMLALRGLGNLTTCREEGGVSEIHIENACMFPVLAGTAWGLFESSKGIRDSSCVWKAGGDGTLRLILGLPGDAVRARE